MRQNTGAGKGAVVQAGKSGDIAMYGSNVTRHEILNAKVEVPELLGELAKHAAAGVRVRIRFIAESVVASSLLCGMRELVPRRWTVIFHGDRRDQ